MAYNYKELISEEKILKTGFLDLSNCGLQLLPEELFELDHLKTLILSSPYTNEDGSELITSENSGLPNKLNHISNNIINLQNLTKLFYSGDSNNRFGRITNIEAISSLHKLKFLNLSFCNIDKPEILYTLKKLKYLFLDYTGIHNLVPVSQLNNLRVLSIKGAITNNFTPIFGLESLEILVLDECIIPEPDLSKLKKLRRVNMNFCRVTRIDSFRALENINSLNLLSNRIENIDSLKHLVNLKHLDLGGNNVANIESLENLRDIETLNLIDNIVGDVTPLKNLKKLSNLNLGSNIIKNIEELYGLDLLESLGLAENQIENIDSISNLSFLKHLSIGGNKIIDITPLSGLNNLESLIIRENPINDYSALLSLNKIQYFDFVNTPLFDQIPPEVREASPQAILEWMRNQKVFQKKIALNYGKILILGNTNVGKSFLLQYLLDSTLPKLPNSTHGLIYRSFRKYKAQLNVFDFGGQEYFHATHKLFFSEDALHILLWSKTHVPRAEDNEAIFDINYWLRSIEQLSRNTGNRIETILVENKIDLQDFLPTLLNYQDLQNKFKDIRLTHASISLEKQKNLDTLNNLVEQRLKTLSGFKKNFTQPYKDVIDKINLLRKDNILITSPSAILTNNTIQSLSVFHNLGLLLYYPEVLPDKVFIDPQSFVKLLYDTILDKNAKINKGKIFVKSIEKLITGNALGLDLDEVFNLLKSFDLIFQTELDSNEYYAPQYLPTDESSPFYYIKNYYLTDINLRIESDEYLLNLILLKLFSHFGIYLTTNSDNLFCRDGLIINKDYQMVYIQYTRSEHVINLYTDKNKSNWNLQIEILNFILEIPKPNSDYNILDGNNIDKGIKGFSPNLGFKHWESNSYFKILVSSNKVDFADWKDVQNAKYNEFESNGMIFKLRDFKFYLTNEKIMKKIFISYSKDDLTSVNVFLKHLANLQRSGIVSSWYCTELRAGSEWDSKIQKEFDSADIICFMVSPNFMATDYIYEYELKKAFERKVNDPRLRIVPIIMEYCSWESDEPYNLAKYTALPYIAKPVSDFGDRNMAWYTVVECLKLMINDGLDPEGDDLFYSQRSKLPKAVIKIFERIVLGEVDNNTGKTKK